MVPWTHRPNGISIASAILHDTHSLPTDRETDRQNGDELAERIDRLCAICATRPNNIPIYVLHYVQRIAYRRISLTSSEILPSSANATIKLEILTVIIIGFTRGRHYGAERAIR